MTACLCVSMVSFFFLPLLISNEARVAEWSKAPDSSSGGRKSAWVEIPPRAVDGGMVLTSGHTIRCGVSSVHAGFHKWLQIIPRGIYDDDSQFPILRAAYWRRSGSPSPRATFIS